jgi:hypothetical protein
MADFNFASDGLIDVGFDPRSQRLSYSTRASWPLTLDQASMAQSIPNPSANTTTSTAIPLPPSAHAFQPQSTSPTLLGDWSMQHRASQLSYVPESSSLDSQINTSFAASYHTSPVDFLSSSQSPLDPNMSAYVPLPTQADALQWNWQEFQNDLMGFAGNDGLPYGGGLSQRSLADSSPTDTYLEVRSLTSSNSDNGWATVDYQNFDGYHEAPNGAVFNPGQTLHIRTSSDSSESHSDCTHQTRNSFGSYEEIPHPLTSPDSDIHIDLGNHHYHYSTVSPSTVSPSAVIEPVQIKANKSPMRSPASISPNSPPGRKQGRKSPTAKSTKPVIRRPSTGKKDNEKRVGRRRGPLLPEQRKQASEIRKLRACLRCKFLKKTVSIVMTSCVPI